jgi:hypothetical protein
MEAGAVAELHADRQTIGDFHLLLADGDAVDDGAPLACEPQRAAAEPATGVQHLFARCDAGLVGKEAVGVEQRLVVGLGRSVPDAIMQRVRVAVP